MGLNTSRGNMYGFVTHTFNTVKGKCYHDCSYCYMKKHGAQKPIRFDKKELTTDLGSGKFIFVGSSNDVFAERIPNDWVRMTLKHCCNYPDNNYLFQSKNPNDFITFARFMPDNKILCTTIETNRFYEKIMGKAPLPQERAAVMAELVAHYRVHITIEPVMDFDMVDLITLVSMCNPEQVNIGADSDGHKLPEPDKQKLLDFIDAISVITKVHKKSNLNRLLR